jgi:membrane-bound lytic murein transglycosylase D
MNGLAARDSVLRTTAVLLLFVVLSSCSRVGLPEGLPPAPIAPGAPEIAVTGEPAPTSDDAPLPPAPEFGVHDPLLASTVADDPRVLERVDFWVNLWAGQQTDLFSRYLDRMATWVHFVDEELERREMPPSLRYLPVVESGYLPSAVSRVGATGLWQIMAPTGRGLGLSITGVVDDRRDPIAATLAALDYLEELHGQFDSWILALAAYNAGPGRISGILNQYGAGHVSTEDERFILVQSRLPAETRDFIPRFYAAATLAGDPAAHGLPVIAPRPANFDEVLVPDATSLDVVARAAGVSEDVILEMNPHYLRGFTPVGEVRTVRVPQGRSFEFERNYALIPPNERLSILEHTVAAGETFSHIASRYGVSVAELTGMNSQVDPRRLQIGMTIMIPVGGAVTTASATTGGAISVASANGTGASARGSTHTVSSGESFWTISRRYGISPEALAAANGRRTGDLIRIGEQLFIP